MYRIDTNEINQQIKRPNHELDQEQREEVGIAKIQNIHATQGTQNACAR